MSSRLRASLLGIGLFAAVFVVFGGIAGHEFLDYDLKPYLTDNPWVRRGLSWDGLRRAATGFDAANWHPVTWLSFMLDVELFGLAPRPMHLENVALHAANACLVFLVLRRLTGRTGASLCLAALFAFHPQRLESVAWIVERKGLLCAFFGLASLIAWTRWTRERRRRDYAAALALFALGVMSKPMLVTWPFAMLLLDSWPLDRARIGWRAQIAEKLPFFALSILAGALTWLAQRSGGAVRDLAESPLPQRLESAVLAYAAYLGKTFWPAHLSIHYPPFGPGITVVSVAAAALGLAAVSALAVALRHRAPWLLVGWLWFLGLLVPVIGLVSIGRQSIADRYAYLPCLGIGIAVVWSATALLDRRPRLAPLAGALAAGLCVALGAWTFREARYWKDTETQCEHVLARDPGNTAVRYLLGAKLVNEGRAAEAIPHLEAVLATTPGDPAVETSLAVALGLAGRTSEAEAMLRDLLRRSPDSAAIHTELARVLLAGDRAEEALAEADAALRHLSSGSSNGPGDVRALLARASAAARLGRLEAASADLARACELEPDAAELHLESARLLEKLARPDEARAALERALALDPFHLEARLTLARLLVRGGDVDGAERELQSAVQAAPLDPEARRGLALVAIARGDLARALPAAREALRLRPGWALAMGDLAWILARVDDPSLRDPEEAVAMGEAAAAATERRHAGILDSLAAAYAARKEIPRAAATAAEALQVALDQRDDVFATRIGRRLVAYRAGRVDRETPR